MSHANSLTLECYLSSFLTGIDDIVGTNRCFSFIWYQYVIFSFKTQPTTASCTVLQPSEGLCMYTYINPYVRVCRWVLVGQSSLLTAAELKVTQQQFQYNLSLFFFCGPLTNSEQRTRKWKSIWAAVSHNNHRSVLPVLWKLHRRKHQSSFYLRPSLTGWQVSAACISLLCASNIMLKFDLFLKNDLN